MNSSLERWGIFFFLVLYLIYNVGVGFLQQSDSALHFSFSDSRVIVTLGTQLVGCACFLSWSAK